ncbi:MAG: MATE family efflux transporter [Polyangiaceae bacterium]|nr:MATE family efflux transporter [Polyangiaceae bacterium]
MVRRFSQRAKDLILPVKELFQLAWPITIAMLGESAIGLVDTKLVGGLGAGALAGVGMATIVFYLGFAMVSGTLRGVKVRSAYVVGEGRPHDAVSFAYAGLAIGAAAGFVLFLAGRDITPVLRLLRVDESMIAPARDFMAARTFGAVAGCMLASQNQYRQGLGDTRTPMLVGIGGNIINAVLAYSLIYGHLGLPALGVRGAGYGTAITEVIQVSVMLGLLWRDRRQAASKKMQPSSIRFKKALNEVLSLGVPTGLHFGFEMLAFTTFTAVLASLGAAELAAHHVALNTIRASFLPGVAVAEATSILVARSLGAGNLKDADKSTWAALLLGVSFMTLCGIAFALFGKNIAAAFSNDAEVVRIAGTLLLVAAIFQTLDAANMILRGALRGAKDVRWVAIVGTSVAWVSIPGSAILFGRIGGLGALGGWFGFILETSLGSSLLFWRWRKGPWRNAILVR